VSSDYDAIRRDNERRYGTDIGRIGRMLLADRYDKRTHFILELLQNAEDALARRSGWEGSRAVSFDLRDGGLRASHCGSPFDDADVRGICGIAEGTKGLTAIGRFGIGFKSVYAVTDRPEIHSGDEDFAIENYVWPVSVPPIERDPQETVFILPFRPHDSELSEEVTEGLASVGARSLLFLRHIEEIAWHAAGHRSGLYLRSAPDELGENVRRVTLLGEETGKPDVEETWILFSREVHTLEGTSAGHAEIAFLVARGDKDHAESVRQITRSPLVAFFPTVLETHLGFLVQGPYRTTPSRDNVPRTDPWNQNLVRETASLLVQALHWLRDHDLLDVAALHCLPLDPAKFGEGSMFAPLFEATKEALYSEHLLPRFDAGHTSAATARLARSKELRQLINPKQLAKLDGREGELVWLSGDITRDSTPELRRYLMNELGVTELTPESIIPRLDKHFLEAQPDRWISNLYEFLNRQRALRERVRNLPLVRLEDGRHVAAFAEGRPQAFLPSSEESGFPTVRRAVLGSEEAREFLTSLGLTEPDPVDDVIRNVLDKYQREDVAVAETQYESDINRMVTAYRTDSKAQREKLIQALRKARFVKSVDANDNTRHFSKPGNVYLATERLKALFNGVASVFLVDDSEGCLRGEAVRDLLEVCGASRYLQPVSSKCELTEGQLTEIRRKAGLERATWANPIRDVTLRGLNELLTVLAGLDPEARRHRAGLLWKALIDVEDRRSSRAFSVEYKWSYSHESKTVTLDAAFVRQLNATAWVPDTEGNLQRPGLVLFESLGWKPNPFLQSKIRFKSPVIETLAREAGIEPGVLDLLKKHGVTSEVELRARLGLKGESEEAGGSPAGAVQQAVEKLLGDTPQPWAPAPGPAGAEPPVSGGGGETTGGGQGPRTGDGSRRGDGRGAGRPPTAGTRRPGSAGGREFVSYVAVHSEDEEPDPDGLDRQARMALEAKAIDLILSYEPEWRRTPTQNPGYDLYKANENGEMTGWCEVKAMTGSLEDRPVGLSRTQFDCAREHGEAYWLYVVEHAGTTGARIIRIQNPAGKARTFTFDRGWLSVAQIECKAQGDVEQQD